MMKESRPWGEFHVIYDEDCKIKRLVVFPQKRLSLQSHQHRDELWLVIRGKGIAQLDDELVPLKPGSLVRITKTQKHRLINNQMEGNLEIIEIQTGTYFGEDDIVRYEDDFDRV